MAATVQNAELIGYLAGEGQFLLDQQYRHAKLFVDTVDGLVDFAGFRFYSRHSHTARLVQTNDDVANFADDVGLDAFGGLVQNQQARIQYQGATNRQLLLLAAGQVAAPALQHLF